MTGAIQVSDDRDRHVRTLTIDNPEKRNALSPELVSSLTEAISAVADDPDIRVLVLTGVGEHAFCSGYDLDAVTDRETRSRTMRRLVRALTDFPYPTVAKINGDAIGGGFNLVTACDLRVAVEDARFGLTPAKLGIVYPDDGIQAAMRAIGPANTKELLFTAELIDGDRATEMGLCNRAVPRADLDEATRDLVTTIAANAPLALSGMKQIMTAIQAKAELSDAEQDWVRLLQQRAEESADYDEGLAAMAESRQPEFEGR